MSKWTGVDLDGVLAFYDGWKGIEHIGDPIPKMKEKVLTWIASGKIIKIFTARATHKEAIPYIKKWLKEHGFPDLEITNVKDFGMEMLYDDRCVQIVKNKGISIIESAWME